MSLQGNDLANAYWNEFVKATTPGFGLASFGKHVAGKSPLPYTPKIDFDVMETGASFKTKTYLTLSPGHVRILSQEQIQWAHAQVTDNVESGKVLKKIDSAVSGGMMKKSKRVWVSRIEFEYP